MTSPLYGNQYSKKFNATFYIKPYTVAFTKPATAVAALAALDGVAASDSFVFKAAQAFADGDYIVVSSPVNAYCVWIAENGADTEKPASPAGCTAYLKVTVATADLADTSVTVPAIVAAINTTEDIVASVTLSTDYTMLAVATQGGTRVTAARIDVATLTSGTEVTAGVGSGDWMKLGGIMEDYSVEPSPNEIRDTTGNIIVTYEDVDITFSLMNVDQRNFDILKGINKTQVSIVIMDKSVSTDPKLYCVNDLTLNASFNPSGDTATIPLKLAKRVTDALAGTSFWTYNVDLI